MFSSRINRCYCNKIMGLTGAGAVPLLTEFLKFTAMNAIPIDKPETKYCGGYGYGGYPYYPYYPYFPQQPAGPVTWPINIIGANGTVITNGTTPTNGTAPVGSCVKCQS
ncbi:unnamed protein product [Medioppia subpectinata]|uniref:Uncharacterized protein n=1 Tax=Medioppia subpectinata TaxID=1979941 RepID=A0A7R9Q2Y3_9ACAR|nr:unnamed protein product [Medioppia subpectinata]CAG2110747.1 unnamed protein product [Medioppia subpectinata]